MIKFNDVISLNLQEQVLKNKTDIAQIKDSIFQNGLGITVLGTVTELPQYADHYGDAYLLGTEIPYQLWVWTRANPLIGEDNDYFLNLGNLSIVGPKGDKGEKGDKGDQGDIGPRGPIGLQGLQGPQGKPGLNGKDGEQGEKGEKGDTGDVGGFINVAGIVDAEAALPHPEVLHDLTKAYLVGTVKPYDLYIQVGSSSEEAFWENVGPLNVATYVTVNGEFQNTWNADTKVNVSEVSSSSSSNSIVRRNGAGAIACQPGTAPTHAVNNAQMQQYVKENAVKGVKANNSIDLVDSNGNANIFFYSTNGITMSTDGTVKIYPASENDIANRLDGDVRRVYQPLIPRDINAYVKAALTDNSHLTLTDQEKTTAKEVLGIPASGGNSLYMHFINIQGTSQSGEWFNIRLAPIRSFIEPIPIGYISDIRNMFRSCQITDRDGNKTIAYINSAVYAEGVNLLVLNFADRESIRFTTTVSDFSYSDIVYNL